jgi:uncharacterized protein (DUF4415 family)
MSPKELTAFRLDLDVLEGLRTVKERDGVPYSVQVDRALRAWLDKKGVMKAVKPVRGKRAARRAE